MEQVSEAAKRAHHRTGRSGLAQIIEGLRVDNILHTRKPYTTHLENEDCMSSSSSCCSGSGGSLNKKSSSGSSGYTRSSYPAPKSQQIWQHINRIE